MIENIRKYTGLMIVVLVLLFVGLVFLGDGVGNSFGSKPVMKVAGQGISQKDFNRHRAAFDLPRALPNTHVLSRETRLLASHYLGDSVIDEQVMPGTIVQTMSLYLQPSLDAPHKFITNRLNIQKAGVEYGVTPSPEEVESFVENVLFADPEGNYDQEAYSDFIKSRVGPIGGTKGFNEYIRDLLTAQNLSKLLGGGIAPEMETVRAIYDTQKQVITAQQISLESAVYEGKIAPTEEELKAFYEENKGNYNSDELRTASYVLIEPDWDAALAESKKKKAEAAKLAEEARRKQEEEKKKAEEAAKKANEAAKPDEAPAPTPENEDENPEKEAPDPANIGEQGDAGEQGDPAPDPQNPSDPSDEQAAPTEEPKEATKIGEPLIATPGVDSPIKVTPGQPNITESKPAPPVTAKEQLTPAEKKEAVEALIPAVNQFFQDLADNNGEDFEEYAANAKYKVVKTEFFAKSDPPKEIASFIQGGKFFLISPDSDPDQLLSNPFQSTDGWVIARLDDVKESVPLTYEEAKVQVSIDLKKKLAREQMIADAKSLHEKLTAAVKAGKTFEEAAKEAEQTVTRVDKLAEGQTFQFGAGRSQKLPDPAEFTAARYTNSGEIAPVEFTPSEDEANRAIIIFVEKKEVTKDEKYLIELEKEYKQLSRFTRLIAFENWLNDRFTESEVEAPNMAQQQP